MTELIIDAENAVLGRLASFSAKKALLGNKIEILNCEKAIMMGREENILSKYRKRRARGGSGLAGPNFPTTPAKIMKRAIRNMLPYKQARGRQAFKRIRCYKGIPSEFKDKKLIKSARGKEGIKLEKISKMLRGGK